MKYDFIIFGGTGLQGRICAKDLLESGYSVMLVGRDSSGIKNLLKNKKTDFLKVDLRKFDDIVQAIVKSNPDVVVNCAELIFNIPIMKACLKTKKSCTDLGGLQSITSDQFKLDNHFKKFNITCITGCGSTPGILNVLTVHALEKFDSVEEIKLGFAWDSNIKKFVIPYSIQSIFDEFTQPPVVYHNGKFIKEDRINCIGKYKFKEVGEQTVYCIVHSEIYTFAKYFKFKGLKKIHYMAGFPDHSIKVIQSLIELGFYSQKEININGIKMRPLDFTIQVLKKIKIPKGYKEKENLWVKIYGKKDNKNKLSEINCIIKTIQGWEDAGTNTGTGRTISIISQMLRNGKIKQKGVYGPEAVIPHKEFIKLLGDREMYVYLDNKRIN
ncbi:MAG: saccharopine dehydrogenase C-terminal domain-containing protein [Nanoarchaeota archaeon]